MAHYEDKYSIREDGAIISHTNNSPIKPIKNSNGYYKYTFTLNGKREQKLIHQVVAKHFLPNPYNHTQVNHKDGNKANNSVGNLEWISSTGNIQHALETGLRKGFMPYDVKLELLHRVLQGSQIRQLAEEVGRREESLSGMLRRTADRENLRTEWENEMKRRRKSVAIRNLEKINNPS
jgi:hypothetical protein